MTAEEIDKWKVRIDGMSHLYMAFLWRFATPGHLYFNNENPELVDHFKKRFDSLGGMTPEISKKLGFNYGIAKLDNE